MWLIVNGITYVILSFTGLLLPQYENSVFNYGFPAFLGEIALMLWLVFKGVKQEALAATNS